MATITNTGSTSSTNSTNSTTAKKPTSMEDLNSDEFLKLLITELSNQDPLNPMDNTQLVQQVSTIRQITATTQLSSTLDAVTTGQNLATATSLIGKKVNALTDKGDNITGVVDKATIEVDAQKNTRTYRLHVGSDKIDLKNVREVLPN